jgi:hypothetical protein
VDVIGCHATIVPVSLIAASASSSSRLGAGPPWPPGGSSRDNMVRTVICMNDHDEIVRYARMLLCGYIEYDQRGVPRKKYLKPETKEYEEARRALACLLRMGVLPRNLQHALANLFDPDDAPERSEVVDSLAYSHRVIAAERRIVGEFAKFRAWNRRRDDAAHSHILQHLWNDVQERKSVEAAVKAAMDRFGLQREAVYKIWKGRDVLQAPDEKLQVQFYIEVVKRPIQCK